MCTQQLVGCLYCTRTQLPPPADCLIISVPLQSVSRPAECGAPVIVILLCPSECGALFIGNRAVLIYKSTRMNISHFAVFKTEKRLVFMLVDFYMRAVEFSTVSFVARIS